MSESDSAVLLTRSLPIWKGNSKQLETLLSLKLKSGKIIRRINKEHVINIIDLLLKYNFDDVINYLSELDDIYWDLPIFDESRNKQLREHINREDKEVGVETGEKCRYCPSMQLVSTTVQTRSGDEPATIIVRCPECGKRWRE